MHGMIVLGQVPKDDFSVTKLQVKKYEEMTSPIQENRLKFSLYFHLILNFMRAHPPSDKRKDVFGF